VIETERLLLRKPVPEDVDRLLDFVADEEVMLRTGGEPGGRETAVELVERWLSRWERNGIGPFVVERDGTIVGRVGFLVWDTGTWRTSNYADAGDRAETELGWAILSSAWGHGYATEAARAALDWAPPGRIVSLIAPDNVRSIRVAVKLGAQPEQMVTTFGPAIVWVHER
jgi:RimJ/RimL family protein N-acetyltransferase